MARKIDYGTLMHRAMRTLVSDVPRDVEANGLPGDHHFFITFDTRHPDAQLAGWLRDRYPEEMTIVLEHQYELSFYDRKSSIYTKEMLLVAADKGHGEIPPILQQLDRRPSPPAQIDL